MSAHSDDVVIIGGGLAGLVAAVQLGAAGQHVVVYEGARRVGGRARTHYRDGFYMNLGPHRLFERGAAVAAFRRLGLPLRAAPRGPNGAFAVWRGIKHMMPTGYCSLLSTGLFCVRAKRELARFLSAIPAVRVSDSELQSLAIGDWLETQLSHPDVIRFVLALVRGTTYTHDPGRQSAAAAIEQLQLCLAGPTLHVHHGWGTLVDALRSAALSAGATINTDAPVVAVETTGGRAIGVTLADGRAIDCRAVIVATGPVRAEDLLGGAWMPPLRPVPVRAAVLDVALSRLPSRRAVFALGIDDLVCFSADSSIVQVAPHAGAVVHLARFLPAGVPGTRADEAALEQLLDLMQPGWRDDVVFRRFLPAVVVSHAMVTAAGGGLLGRPGGRVNGLENVFLAGDWIGPTGQLADAAVASGLRAARAVQCLAAQEFC